MSAPNRINSAWIADQLPLKPGCFPALNTLLLVIMLLIAQQSAAVEVNGLYDVELPVSGSGAAERNALARQGLAEVLVRVSGSRKILANERIEQALARSDTFLRQFSYVTNSDAAEGSEEQQRLQLYFDATLIDGLLRRAKLPLWGKNRPVVLVWLTIDDGQSRHIVSAGDENELKSAVIEHAKRRGVPLLFPLMDLHDEAALPVVEAWGMFKESLLQASARYQPKAILAGRVYQNGDRQWTGRWQFLFNDEMSGLNVTAADIDSYPESAMDFSADRLADFYAVNTATLYDQQISLQVDGVNSLTDYAQVTEYLQNLAAVVDVAVAGVDGAGLLLTLTTEGEVQKMVEAIALDHKLVPQQSGTAPPANPGVITLFYRWNKP